MVDGEKNRLDHFDVVKGMAIIALVASHAYGYYPVKIFTKFYMALFVFCSGYFIRPERSLKELIYKRWKGLYVPFVCFCTLFLITHNGLSKLGITFPKKDWMEIGRDFLGILMLNNREYLLIQVWFVTMLMLIEFCYILLYKIFFLFSKDKKMVNLMCLACGGVFYVANIMFQNTLLGRTWYSWCIIIGCCFSSFFLLPAADLLRYMKCEIRDEKKTVVFLVIGLFFLSWCTTQVSEYSVDIRQNINGNWLLYFFNVIVGIWCCFYFAKAICDYPKISKVLSIIGQSTMWILFLHVVVFKFIGLFQIRMLGYVYEGNLGSWGNVETGGFWGVVYPISGIVVPCGMKILFQKVNTQWKRFLKKDIWACFLSCGNKMK